MSSTKESSAAKTVASFRKKFGQKLKGSATSQIYARDTVEEMQKVILAFGFLNPNDILISFYFAVAFFVETLHLPISHLRMRCLERLARGKEEQVSSFSFSFCFFFFSFFKFFFLKG